MSEHAQISHMVYERGAKEERGDVLVLGHSKSLAALSLREGGRRSMVAAEIGSKPHVVVDVDGKLDIVTVIPNPVAKVIIHIGITGEDVKLRVLVLGMRCSTSEAK